jgi:hypothetical protein
MNSTTAPKRSSTLARVTFVAAQALTVAGFVIIVAGLSKLQKSANKLGLNKLSAAAAAPTVDAYDATFSHGLVTPYPLQTDVQFGLQWFLVFFQLCILLFNLVLAAAPRLVPAGKSTALTFLAVALTLTIEACNSLAFFHRSPVAAAVFSLRTVDVTFAGALIVAVANGFTIISLGLWVPEVVANDNVYAPHHHANTHTGNGAQKGGAEL